ncbi:MAG TPA: selenocysteine-specific translation factor, partial [Microbacterium sp.]|nr:selenocysteine-specific translation factor [Microbacterium sp.]
MGEDQFLPGESSYARLHIDGDPVPLLPGDRFIARGFARTEMGGSTLGGGIVLDVAPPHRRRRDPALHAELERMSRGDSGEGVALRIQRAGLRGMTVAQLALETGLDPRALDTALATLDGSGMVLRVDA